MNGNSNGWARRLWDFTKPNQYLGGSGGAGLGYGPGAVIGAALALKGTGKFAVSIQSDGDMLMTFELVMDRSQTSYSISHGDAQ